jgi:hypothetical protein
MIEGWSAAASAPESRGYGANAAGSGPSVDRRTGGWFVVANPVGMREGRR